jgi:hypothetical protein
MYQPILIIVTAILTILVFTLAIISCHLMLKRARLDLNAGVYDKELAEEKEEKRHSRVLGFIYYFFSSIIFLALLIILVSSIVYRANGEQVKFGDKTVLVIASDSMDGYYDDNYKLVITSKKADAEKDQFATGDILSFTSVNKNDTLELFEVYAYKNSKGNLITHRYIGNSTDGKYYFRGDNTAGNDSLVERSQIVYRYTGKKVTYIGNVILFSKSYYGLYSLCSILLAYTIYEVYNHKLKKLSNARYELAVLTNGVSKIAAEGRAKKLINDPTMSVRDEFAVDNKTRAIVYEKKTK